MAANSRLAQGRGGYECEFVDQVPDDFACELCERVAKEPHLTVCCGHYYCHSCIRPFLDDAGKPCPGCDAKAEAVLNKNLKRKILALRVRCTMKDRGCEWIRKLEDLDAHLDVNTGECEHVDVECPLKCNLPVQKRELPTHLQDGCPKRDFYCQYCNFKATHEVVCDTHWPECKNYPVQCPNACMVGAVERGDLDDHLKQCSLQEVDCEFSYAGCNERLERQHMERHMQESTQKHLAMMSAATLRMSREFEQKLQEQREEFRGYLERKERETAELLERKDEELDQKLQEKDEQMKQEVQKQRQERDEHIKVIEDQLQKKDREVQKKDEDIQKRLHQQEQGHELLQRSLQDKDQQIKTLQKAVQTQIQQRDMEVKKQLQERDQQFERKLQQKYQLLQKKDEQIEEQLQQKDRETRQQLQRQHEEFQKKVQQNNEHFQKSLAEKVELCQKKDKELEQRLREKDVKITAVQTQLQKKDKELEQKLREKDEKITAVQTQLQKKDKENEARIINLGRQIQERRKQIEEMMRGVFVPVMPFVLTVPEAIITFETRGRYDRPISWKDFLTVEDEQSNDIWDSPPMSTHYHGYELCIRVWNKARYVVVAVCSMVGEYDDQLEWPVTCTITVQLLNQHQNKDHITASGQFTWHKPTCTAVVGEIKSKLHPISDLGWNARNQTRYLKNDGLKIKVASTLRRQPVAKELD